jgi:hypothetical protein
LKTGVQGKQENVRNKKETTITNPVKIRRGRFEQCCGSRQFLQGSGSYFHFDTDPNQTINIDPNHYCSKEVVNLKRYFLYILTWFSSSVGPLRPNQQAYVDNFSLPVNFVVPSREGSGSGKMKRIGNTGCEFTFMTELCFSFSILVTACCQQKQINKKITLLYF